MHDETRAATDSTGGELAPAATSEVRQEGRQDDPIAINSVIDDAEATLADVEKALERLESRQYGTCEICNAVIEQSILERSPVARRCGLHSV